MHYLNYLRHLVCIARDGAETGQNCTHCWSRNIVGEADEVVGLVVE
jgi:hypothetical protein